MSDYIPAEIRIGGKIAKRIVPDLCAVIGTQHIATEWGNAPFKPTTEHELLEARTDGVLQLYDDEASWGEFDDLEEFLRENDIPYSRQTVAKYEYDAEIVEFRPGNDPVVLTTLASGEHVVPVAALANVMEAMEQAAQTLERAAIEKARQALRETLPPEISPLEPFSISID